MEKSSDLDPINFPVVIETKLPFNLSIHGVERNVTVSVGLYIAYLKHEEDIYIMPSVNHNDGQFLMDIRFDDSQLTIYDKTGKTLIPKEVKINEGNLNKITIHQRYKICKVKGKPIFFNYKFLLKLVLLNGCFNIVILCFVK